MFIFIKRYQRSKAQKHASIFGIFKNNLGIIRSFFSSLMNGKFMRSQSLSVLAFALILSIGASSVWAADGSGTNTVSPTSVIVSSTGNTETFTFTAAETMDSGGFEYHGSIWMERATRIFRYRRLHNRNFRKRNDSNRT